MKVRKRVSLANNRITINPFVSQAQRVACYAKDDPAWDCSEWSEATKGKTLPKTKKATKNARKPSSGLRLDPTRTVTIRRQFSNHVHRQFSLLKGRILKFIRDDNAFALTANTLNCQPGQIRDELGRCGPGIGTEIPREEMPQIPGGKLQEFITYANARGIQCVREDRRAEDLSPTQSRFRQERVDSIPQEKLYSEPVIVSQDDYILDGTHRWVKAWQNNPQAILATVRVTLLLKGALALMKGFSGVKYAANANYQPFIYQDKVGWAPTSNCGEGLIEVPDIRQHDHYSCGAAAAMAVGKYFGVGPDSIEEWKKALGTDIQGSTSPTAIETYLRSIGLEVDCAFNMSLKDLHDARSDGRPVITPVQDYGPEVPGKAKFEYGHYLTVIGVAMGYVFCQDSSADNVLKGEGSDAAPGRVMIREQDFLDLWHDRDIKGNEYIRFGIVVGPGSRKVYQGKWTVQNANPYHDALGRFAEGVNEAAADSTTGKFGDNKTFISHVHKAYAEKQKAQGKFAQPLEMFKQNLIKASQAGLVTLSRADLPQVMNPKDLDASTTKHGNSEFHFVLHKKPTGNENPNHDEQGRFAAGPGSTSDIAHTGIMGKLKAAGAAIGHVEHLAKTYAQDKIGAAVAKLPAGLQSSVHASFAVGKVGTAAAFSTWRAGQNLAERVAKERGATDEEAKRLRGVLSGMDMATFKPVTIALHSTGLHAATLGALSFIPPASVSYLAYSTARNPLATLRAAGGVVKDAVKGLGKIGQKLYDSKFNASSESLELTKMLADNLKAHNYDDWYIALFSAALDETKDGHKALILANQAYKGSKPTINAKQFEFHTSAQKITEFQKWLREQFKSTITGKSEEELWEKYIQSGFEKGAGRAFDDWTAKDKGKLPFGDIAGELDLPSFYAGGKREFLKSAFAMPETVEKVKLLAGRTFDDLEGCTEDMATKLGRLLSDGLIEGKNPRDVGKEIADQLDVSENRAQTIARTEIIRAHAEGQLDAFEKMGVTEIGIDVEWSTAGDLRVCPECDELNGTIYTVEEAHGLLPYHPNCRCAFLPHSDEWDKEDKEDIEKRKQEVNEELGVGVENAARNKEGKFQRWVRAIDKARALNASLNNLNPSVNVFCSTGPGGGVDPTCSPGGSGGIIPPVPTFYGSFGPGNKSAAETVHTLAKIGNLQAIKDYDGTPSPKFQEYKQAVIEHLEKNAPAPTPLSSGLPTPQQLDFVKNLPGSTSPELWKEKGADQKWVVKSGKEPVLQNEADTDAAYRALGVNVPHSGMVEGKKVASFIEGAQSLHDWEKGKSTDEITAMHKEISKGFVADALLANWDVVGLSKDNILIDKGKPVRVDNGGGLKYRAQGEPKGAKFGENVEELKTLLDASKNPQTAKVFKGITHDELFKQIKEVISKKDAVLKVITDPQTKAIMEKRFEHLKELHSYTVPKPQSTPAPSPPAAPPPSSSPLPATPVSLHTGEGILDHVVKNTPEPTKLFTKAQLEKIKLLNPDGIKDGKFFVPLIVSSQTKNYIPTKMKQQDQVAYLKTILPLGTQISIKSKFTSIASLTKTFGEEGTFTTTGTKSPSAKSTPAQTVTSGPTVTSPQTYPESHSITAVTAHLPKIESNSTVKLPPALMYDKAAHRTWRKTLTPDEKSAISSWKGSAKSIRAAVSSGNVQPGSTAAHFMSAINKAPNHVGVTYRGVHGTYVEAIVKQISDAGIGGTWADSAPHCTSINSSPATSFSAGDLLFRVSTKSGAVIHKEDGFSSDGSSSEAEVVGRPNTQYKITGLHHNVTVNHAEVGHKSKVVKHIVDLEEI